MKEKSQFSLSSIFMITAFFSTFFISCAHKADKDTKSPCVANDFNIQDIDNISPYYRSPCTRVKLTEDMKVIV